MTLRCGAAEEVAGEAHDERSHASMKPKDLSALILLGAVWGLSFIFIRVGVPQLGPFFLMVLRVGLAVLALLPFAVALGRVPELRKRWRQFVVMGFLNAAVPFSLIAFAEITITASLAAILNSTTVLFSVLVAAAFLGDPLTRRKLAGVAMGMVGVAVLVGLDPLPLNGPVQASHGATAGVAQERRKSGGGLGAGSLCVLFVSFASP